jgi:hypothetical protein
VESTLEICEADSYSFDMFLVGEIPKVVLTELILGDAINYLLLRL